MRSSSVTSPRMASHAGNASMVPPTSIAVARSRSRPSFDAHTTPPTRSWCPPMYFVAECSTKSNPCSAGVHSAGEANVLSTTDGTPAEAATSPSVLRSATVTLGLAIVST